MEMAESERAQTANEQENSAKEPSTLEAGPATPDTPTKSEPPAKEQTPEEQMDERRAGEPTPSSKADVQKPTANDDAKEGRPAEDALEAQASPQVAYKTHVQTYGWQDWVRDGAISGTQGESKRLEGINIKLESAPHAGGIEYRTHVQTYGWQDWVRDGAMSGTEGESKRLEAIQIQLTGAMAEHYDVWYHVHAQTYGWLGWTSNGARAGTATYSKRLEGIEIRILPKGSAAPGSTEQPYITRAVQYRTHVQTYGWQDWKFDGEVSGTSGQSKRLEGININLPDMDCSGGIEYRTHVQTYGWQDWARDGAMSGTEGESKRLEAIQIAPYGQVADRYDVWYRVHAQTFGWMGWARNGEEAGTAGYSKRLEAIQIVLVPKDSQAPTADFMGIQEATSDAFRVSTPGSAPAQTASTAGPSTAGALKVKGNQLVDHNEQPIQLRGISTHGLAWFPAYVNDDCFKQLRNNWNANVVRLAMYTEEYGGYCSGGDQAYLTELVKKGVRFATDNDLYAIVDWHILSDGNPNRHTNEAQAFFADMSSTFRDNQNVLYEICNEPNGGTSWDEIKQYANQVIPVIRQNDPDAVIIVGTPTWSQEIDKAAASPLSYDNVMYALHFYAATHKDDLRNRMVSAVRGGLPVFVSEFGICDASGNGAIDEASANSWITTMNSLGVSWCMWSLCNKAESASAIKSSCQATSGFGADDLSASGSWLLKALNGSLPAGTDSSKTYSGDTSGSTPPQGSAPAVSFSSGSFACKATPVSSWQAGNGKTCYQYDLSVTNKGADCASWSITVPFNKAIALTNGWNGTYATRGTDLVIRNMSYNGGVAEGATLSGIGFQVTADAGLSINAG